MVYLTDKAYVPTSAYNPKIDTAISKSNLQSGILQFAIRKNMAAEFFNLGQNQTLYTVPAGKTLFLTSLDITATAIGNSEIYVSIDKGITLNWNTIIASAYVVTTTYNKSEKTISFSYPIKILQTESLMVNSQGSGVNARVAFTGYEIDNALLPTFN